MLKLAVYNVLRALCKKRQFTCVELFGKPPPAVMETGSINRKFYNLFELRVIRNVQGRAEELARKELTIVEYISVNCDNFSEVGMQVVAALLIL
jgi:hypothetical protein